MDELSYKVNRVHLSELSKFDHYDIRFTLLDEVSCSELHSYFTNSKLTISCTYEKNRTEYTLEIKAVDKQKIWPVSVIVDSGTNDIIEYINKHKITRLTLSYVAPNNELRATSPSYYLTS